ncbi:Mediator of RNA polymerase II transcription subunit 7 [Blastocladiella emersonii ATCC 22665]|nr:Mediator of RNA polymerase II transcription subunit 7 [Blastocladiella emersonii ATCC 22665]
MTLFPLPPPWFERYTDDSLQLHAERKRLEADGHDLAALDASGAASVPVPSSFNLDPPPPIQGAYTMFGEAFSTESDDDASPSLASAPSSEGARPDRRGAIKTLVYRAAKHYISLLDALSSQPSTGAAGAAMEQVQHCLLEAMRLVGDYRTHQALETLLLMQQKLVFDGRLTASRIRASLDATQAILRDLEASTTHANLSAAAAAHTSRQPASEARLQADRLKETSELWSSLAHV